MRVTVFGATGAVGSRVVTEALARGHQVTTVLRDAYPAWLHTYNHRRGHTALAGKPPVGRVPSLTGRYT